MATIVASLAVDGASAASPSLAPGQQFEIRSSYETSQRDSDGSESNTGGHSILVERVVAIRDGALELEYDLSQDATAEDRAREWKLPARILRRPDGSVTLLNRAQLENRLQRWLDGAGWTREACGRWYFTWNAFRVECEPESILEIIAAIDLASCDLREGSPYREVGARGPGTITRLRAGPEGAHFRAVMDIDPESVRRERAEGDVALGELLRRPIVMDDALRQRERETISGTIEVTFETDSAGLVRRRTKVTRMAIETPGGSTETHTRTETVERRRLPDLARHSINPGSHSP